MGEEEEQEVWVTADVNHAGLQACCRGMDASAECLSIIVVPSRVVLEHLRRTTKAVVQQGPPLSCSACPNARIGEVARWGAPPIAMAAEGPLAVRSWGGDLVPCVRAAVHRAWAARLIHERFLFGIVSEPAVLRWEGVTDHKLFRDLATAMPPVDQGGGHRWNRADVVASLCGSGNHFAAGNVFWGGNPILNITAAAELLCWGEAAILVPLDVLESASTPFLACD